ncbi:DinB family protein [Aliifodinibius sp. S!AR15-10]|uniref:DinB family protein n=1 Tax=Aliifodinibius sp. S!AR15-10 TaxID=2950437 RepID=UPI002856031D|nr:DinB family protein [Aliifodinibius sp. S!AR15-10]MDR8392601.1 DinB family protein [Aliifodinibius sp. S!AR15-10]
MSTTWKSLITELRNLQFEFIEVAQQLEQSKREKPGVCGSWSPKQVIAHITGWDKEVIRQFELFRDGLEKAIEHDIDEFNKNSVEDRNHLSWDETITELQQAHKLFYEMAKSISSGERSKNEDYREWIEVQIDHYKHHTEQLEQWV